MKMRMPRFPRGGRLWAVALLAVSMVVTGCGSGTSPGSDSQTQDADAQVLGLDPRYEEGAFGAWSVLLPTDSEDRQAWTSEHDDPVGSEIAVQSWLSQDHQTAVFGYSPSKYRYASSLTAVNMADGSVLWTVNLKDHRHGSTEVDSNVPLIGMDDVHCLPMSVAEHIACDSIGLISMADGTVTPIPQSTDFIGVGEGPGGQVIVGNLGSTVRPESVAVWDLSGQELWRRDDLVLGHSSVGTTWAVALREGTDNVYEVISLTDGSTLSSLEVPSGAMGNLAMATTEGVATVAYVSDASNGYEFNYRMDLVDPSGAPIRTVAEQVTVIGAALGLPFRPEESPREMPTPEAAVAMLEGHGRVGSWDKDWFSGDESAGSVTRFASPDVPVPGTGELGLVGRSVLTSDADSLDSFAVADAAPLWTLDLSSADPNGWFVNRVQRADRYLFFVQYGHDFGYVAVVFIAPGTPAASAASTGGGQWSALAASKGGPDVGLSTTLSAATSTGQSGGASAGSQPEGTVVTVPSSRPDTGTLPSIGVSRPAGLEGGVTGLQAFADDLAAGNFDKIRDYCWTMASSTMDRQYFAKDSRAAILAALSRPGSATETGARWDVSAGTVVASQEELSSPYACPVYQAGGVVDPVTADDARLLMDRVVGVATGSPIRSGDDGHYTLVCPGEDWSPSGGSPTQAPMAGRQGPTDADVEGMNDMLDGTLSVTWGRTHGSYRYFTVTSSASSVTVTVRQDTTNSAVCVGDLS